MKEGLIDILILGSGAIDIEVKKFKQLTKGTDVLVYPCLYGWPSKYHPIPAELARGLAVNYWYQGADGIYLFNWFPHSSADGAEGFDASYQMHLLRQIGAQKALLDKDKFFAADRGGPQREYPHNWLHAVLPVTLETGEEAKVPILVGEDFSKSLQPRSAASPPRSFASLVELKIECDKLSNTDTLRIQLNQRTLTEGTRVGTCITISLTQSHVKLGRNQINILVTNGKLTVTGVEIHVDYQ